MPNSFSEQLHAELMASLQHHAGNGTQHTGNAAYLGTSHPSYHVSNPIKRIIVKEFKASHRDLAARDFIHLLEKLYASPSHDEKTLASMLIGYYSKLRSAIATENLDRWLHELEGWAEIDSLCQSNFSGAEILLAWDAWEPFLIELSHHSLIAHRRASLVFLVPAVAHVHDDRLLYTALKNIETLKHEKDILITKAISWLLRSLTKKYPQEVTAYLDQASTTLPAIAVRETRRKLLTGRK